ncbi:Oidioi.mRNA.OKI2018_I69.PAR.g12374.t1.cds [Oikopleura dioica]|uniref:Oidioi.mRNA.OKI2018_I69.PAR.g12374.t1.cds n=1 Tax=Oikopleura dioica TaxID=34765 RepID=A0ABN7RZS3_OIKDI|nr:Oidioi.mRNA.OKI2018_I69.PAR.g12374.t1.cds [Oikopleura dioica]
MLNICSFWEINPLTNRVRVRAPKTKAEPYPDYDTEEEGTAKLLAGLCNRKIPRGQARRSRRIRGQAPRDRGEEASELESGFEEETGSPTKGETTLNGANNYDYSESEISDDYSKSSRRREVKSRGRKRRRVGSMDEDSIEESQPVARRKRRRIEAPKEVRRKRRKNDDGYTITSDDFRKFRDSIYDATHRSQKSKNRRIEISSGTDSEQISDFNDQDDRSSTKSDSKSADESQFSDDDNDKRNARDGRKNSRNPREHSVIVENPAYNFHKRKTEKNRAPAGRVITVRKPKESEKSEQLPKSRKRGRPSNSISTKRAPAKRRRKSPEYSENEGTTSDTGDNNEDDEPVLESTANFWSR